jgi:hypothetical protein
MIPDARVRAFLRADESVLAVARPSPLNLLHVLVWVLLGLLFALGGPSPVLVLAALAFTKAIFDAVVKTGRILRTRIVVTNERLLIISMFFGGTAREVPLRSVTGVELQTDLLDKLLGLATIYVDTRGEYHFSALGLRLKAHHTHIPATRQANDLHAALIRGMALERST